MHKKLETERPPFETVFREWQSFLGQRGWPAECLWIFEENLVFETDASAPGGFRLSFQTRLTPPPVEAEVIAYDHFSNIAVPVVFYRLGTWRGKSVCVLLCDAWFEKKSESEGYLRRDDWLISFYPGAEAEIPEITDIARWKERLVRDRPLHELDFCMTLRAVHETLAHGRVLSTYERYALRFLHVWRRWLD